MTEPHPYPCKDAAICCRQQWRYESCKHSFLPFLNQRKECARALDADWFDGMPLTSHAKQWLKDALPAYHALETPVNLLLWVIPETWVKDVADM